MKTLIGAALLVLVMTGSARAQDPLVRADASGTLGWLNVDTGGLSQYNNWSNSSLLAEGSVGWYWTDHVKTELAAGLSTEDTVYGTVVIPVDGQPVVGSSRITFSTRRIGVTQLYQFRDNEWFHPYVGAGVDFVWKRTERRDDPIYAYDPVTRQSRLVRGILDQPPRTDLRALPVLAGGFKAYVTPHAFFRGDLRTAFRDGPDEVVLRFGFGVDF